MATKRKSTRKKSTKKTTRKTKCKISKTVKVGGKTLTKVSGTFTKAEAAGMVKGARLAGGKGSARKNPCGKGYIFYARKTA